MANLQPERHLRKLSFTIRVPFLEFSLRQASTAAIVTVVDSNKYHIANRSCKRALLTLAVMLFVITETALGQTSAFHFQGRLTDATNPATGSFDMQFKLFNNPVVGSGIQQGPDVTNSSVQVTNGFFSLTLDFGNVFDGSARFLEISLRPTGSPNPRTILSPRQPVASTPYSIRSASAATADTATNATQLGGMSPTSYVQFNPTGNVGIGTSTLSPTETPNHRLGVFGGPAWTTDFWGGAIELENAAAIGWRANSSGTRFGIGRGNNGLFFFRTASELGTTTSPPIYDLKIDNSGNVGIGTSPVARLGVVSSTASAVDNTAYFAAPAIGPNASHIHWGTTGDWYIRSASAAGKVILQDTDGNVGIGTVTPLSKLAVQTFSPSYGITHTDGTVTIGSYIDSQGGWLGTRSNHPLHFFTNDSTPRMTMNTSGNVGIGSAPDIGSRLRVASSGAAAISAINSSGGTALYGSSQSGVGILGISDTNYAGLFQGTVRVTGGRLQLQALGSAGGEHLCRNANDEVSTCSSSVRYKNDIQPFGEGLSLIKQLRPITYKWIADNQADVGFGAEDVAKINPLFITYNSKGEVEGVKYDRLSVLFANAIQEQQEQIKQQQALIERQQRRLDALTKLVCQTNPQEEVCRQQKR